MFMSINSQGELADTYRYMAQQGSVFSLTALYEPFGLAPIEAMSTGLPVAVTQYGGPSEVLFDGTNEYGVLLDVHDTTAISSGLHKVFDQYDFYQKQGYKRVMEHYTWAATAKRYIEAIFNKLSMRHQVKVELPECFLQKGDVDMDGSFIKNRYK